jgi:glycosyltransferase involved in cell wall biosynthesis
MARWLKPVVRLALGLALRRNLTIVQNPDDERLLIELGVPAGQVRRIAGSGIDLDLYHPQPEPVGPPITVLPARLLWDKGVGEFVEAARLLLRRGVTARFVLAGEPDPHNRATVPTRQVEAWVREGVVEHLGWVKDMPALLASCHVVCLPSYREGLPRALLEGAAAGRPIVTTNVPGCREIVTDGVNGFLVRPGDATDLAAKLGRLLSDAGLRRRMGVRGREIAEERFGSAVVIGQVLDLYREALA